MAGFGANISTAVSGADRKAAHVSRHAQVTLRECEDMKRRLAYEADPAKWLRYYHAEAFTRPFEKPHIAIIEGAMKAFKESGRYAVAAERGIGKSTILWGLVELLALSGQTAFPTCIPWEAKALKRAFRFWRTSLCFNARLLADYPEICAPFAHAKGVSQRLAATTWQDTGEPTGAQLAITDGLIVLPDSRGCIGGSTINGNPRGLNHATQDGKVLRPTLALLDDVQDRAVAKSRRMIDETIQIIDGDVAGIGEAGTRLPMLMCSNCIEDDDVMAHYLAHEQWDAHRIPCIESWPIGWDDGKGDTAKLWDEWYGLHRGGKGAKTFYRKNKAAMTSGMELSSPSTYKGDEFPDHYCGVMATYYSMGHEAFHAEKQQKPLKQGTTIYNLSAKMIMERTTDRNANEIPEQAAHVVAAIDVNPAVGLSWGVAAFAEQTAHIIDYGRRDMSLSRDMPEQEYASIVYEELVKQIKTIAARPYNLSIVMFDARGWNYEAAYNLSANGAHACGVAVRAAMGFGARQYRSPFKHKLRTGPYWHDMRDKKRRPYVAYCSDFWREIAQRSWLGSLGAPGTCDLPRGNHREFADQICREPLLAKMETPMGLRWEFASLPGHHDFGDVMHMLYMAADYVGMSTGGQVGGKTQTQKQKQRRRVQHVSI